jgi:type III secretion protein U
VEEKTEDPTPKKLQDARDRGEVVRSADVPSSLVYVALIALLALGAPYFWVHINQLAGLPKEMIDGGSFEQRLPWFVERLLIEFILLCLPPVVLAFGVAMLGGFLQVKAVFSLEPITPKMERLNPVEGLKRLFGTRSLVGVLLMVVKCTLLGVIIFLVVRGSAAAVVKAPYLSAMDIRSLAASLLTPVFAWAAVVYLVMAAADYLHQHHEFMKQNRMSIDEVRREYKDMEGDPLIKSKRRELFREISMNRMMDNVRTASVVVVNPTHIAVALYYEKGKTGLPMVVAKGEDALAARIRAAAEAANVPILHNVKLARQLYASTPLDHYIHEDLIEPVAEVLRWVKRLHESRWR